MSNGLDPDFPLNASAAGGTDNPGGDTSHPGHGVQTETGAPVTGSPPVPGQGSDYTGTGAIPPSGGPGFADDADERSADPEGGVTHEPDGSIREAGEGETQGMTGTESGEAPSAFPEPNP